MKEENFDVLYGKLNKSQREAVDSIDGPVMVIAGPGTGKTTVLTLRIANILKKTDTPPSGILAITFTDAGVRSVRSKLRDVIGDTAQAVRVHTFHSFASSIISEFPDYFPHLHGTKQISDIDKETIIRKILEDNYFEKLRPVGEPDFYINSIIGSISDAKREDISPEYLKIFALNEIERIKNDKDSVSTRGKTKGLLKGDALREIEKYEKTIVFSKVYEDYERLKSKGKFVDFDDLILEVLRSLDQNKLLLQLIQEKFLYIHIDEHQDTNDSQNKIVTKIADFFENPNVFIVGDEKQAIYRFQGASVENFLRFKKVWKDVKVISLDTNYRSHGNIVDASFSMIENNYQGDEHKDLRVRLKSGDKIQKNKIRIVESPDQKTMEDFLVNEVEEVVKSDPDATVAIITRKNKELDQIIKLFEFSKVTVSSERRLNIFSHPAGIIFFDLLEFFLDFSRIDLLGKTISAGLWGLSFSKALEIIRLLKSGNVNDLDTNIPNIKILRDEMCKSHPLVFLYKLSELSYFRNFISTENERVEIFRGIISLSEIILKEGDINSPAILIKRLVEHRNSTNPRFVTIETGSSLEKVKAMTSHKSKGLEFDYVFIPYANEESWNSKGHATHFKLPVSGKDGEKIKDERRLFYVALTRAKKNAVILYSLRDVMDRVLSPVSFISELGDDYLEKNLINQKQDFDTVFPVMESKESEISLVLKRHLLEKGLSVTALNHYLECPNKFLYLSVLKIPQAPTTSSEKGNVMHEAMSLVWKSDDRGEKVIVSSIEKALENFKQSSFLSLLDKEIVVREINKISPVISKDLVNHFKINGLVHSEEWVSGEILVKVESESLAIKIHGKLDAVIEQDRDVLVFDYKTRQAMSVASLKGETKSGDGGYFRQLVFYKTLLLNDHKYKTKNIKPSLVFLVPDKKGQCQELNLDIKDTDISKLSDEVLVLAKDVFESNFQKRRCQDSSCEWCALRFFS